MTDSATPLQWELTPREALRRWPADRPVVMLHSGRPDAKWSRYSVLAEPAGALVFEQGRSRWIGKPLPTGNGETREFLHDPFADLDRLSRCDEAIYLGYLGYDLGRVIERLPDAPHDDRGWADLHMARCPGWLVHDTRTGKWSAHGTWRRGGYPSLNDLPATPSHFTAGPAEPQRSRAEHEAAVQSALEYIAAGDIFQVNLAQRFTADFAGSPRMLYDALATASPAWYGAYVELFDDAGPPTRAMCSASPELFLQLDHDGQITTRPIKGTRPANDATQERDTLRDSPKDAAELHMIVDLLRNDLGRVCSYGSIKVAQSREIETHPTVHHGVATIRGQLHPSRSLRHLLRATFPGGSITGAPKVRAMQIIDELEPVKRGPYCGAVGCLFPNSEHAFPQAVFNITIRTLLADTSIGRVDFSVGGGIVADSQPALEYEETLDKAAALLQALSDQKER